MLTTKKIIEEINRLMVLQFPEAQAHIGFCPEGFERPAYLITAPKLTRADATRTTVLVTVMASIGYFTFLNEKQLPDVDELMEKQNEIMDIFREGCIRIGDRCPHVKSNTGTLMAGEAYVDIAIEYYDDRLPAQPEAPLMQSVETTTKINMEG